VSEYRSEIRACNSNVILQSSCSYTTNCSTEPLQTGDQDHHTCANLPSHDTSPARYGSSSRMTTSFSVPTYLISREYTYSTSTRWGSCSYKMPRVPPLGCRHLLTVLYGTVIPRRFGSHLLSNTTRPRLERRLPHESE
jgi:hypothetical protein